MKKFVRSKSKKLIAQATIKNFQTERKAQDQELAQAYKEWANDPEEWDNENEAWSY